MRDRKRLASQIEGVQKLEREVADAIELIELAEAEGDAAWSPTACACCARWPRTPSPGDRSLLSGEADGNDAYIEINAGAGGTEAQDWAEMLLRMYIRWAERTATRLQLMEESEGEQAGIKSRDAAGQGPNTPMAG